VNRETVFREALASVSVFLVALPLCMGIAVASGVPPVMGILTGIVGGIVVGSLAGAPLQVSGPAAGLTVIVFDLVQQYGLEVFGVIVFLSGLFQVIAGYSKLGRWFRAAAPAVIYAMLAGIGVLIFASQFHVMVDDVPHSSGLMNLATIPQAIEKALVPTAGGSHQIAAAIGVMSLVVLVGWNHFRPRLPAFFAAIPAPLLAVAAATIVATTNALPIAYVDAPDSMAGLISLPSLASFTVLSQPAIWMAAFGLAVVASAESLLCATALDKMHDGAPADLDREVAAQGVGNAVLGLLGGLPLTGVIVRSTVNIEAGSTTRISAILHGFWLCLTVMLIPWSLELIPLASLAAVLVHIGYKLINVNAIRELAGRGRGELLIYGVTVAGIVSLSLLKGLLLGVVLSVFHLAWKTSRFEFSVNDEDKDRLSVDMRGVATFFSFNHLVDALEQLDGHHYIVFNTQYARYIDHACFIAIRDWERRRSKKQLVTRIQWPPGREEESSRSVQRTRLNTPARSRGQAA
jgi:MFS superfamily sulfate permease-like transporter